MRAFQQSERPYRRSTPNPSFALLGFLTLCLLVAVASGAVTATSVHGWFTTLRRPPGAPPNWLFGPVWTTLYTAMAIAAWLVWRQDRADGYDAVRLWGWQLGLNALWTPAFFGLRSTLLGVVVIIPLVLLVGITAWRFWRLQRVAGVLMVPYLAWTAYAAYLTIGFFVLNGLPR